MGNNNGKQGNETSMERNLDQVFTSMSNHSRTIPFSELKKAWAPKLDPNLYTYIERYMAKLDHEVNKQNFKDLCLCLCKADSSEKAKTILRMISNTDQVSRNILVQFIESVLQSVLIIQDKKSLKSFKSWTNRISSRKSDNISINAYANYFVSLIDKENKNSFDSDDIRPMLVQFDIYLTMICIALYEMEDDESFALILPKWKCNPMDSGKNLEDLSVLDLVRVIFINSQLPVDYQGQWRLLFSSSINGESFSRLSGQILQKGATVIVIKDKDGHIFGGFASHSWNLGPNFFGDAKSFLFTLFPHMRVFAPSGFNDNYQYINVGQQTMPNGLGMGGKLEYFGLWLSADYGSGSCSESCTTYRNYQMMSGTKEFTLAHIEVWGVGPPPPTAAEAGERSCLDGNLEAKAILELAGKSNYSDGLREDSKD